MTVDELKEAGKALYGYGWQTALASSLGIDGSTVRRWIGSGVGIPSMAKAAIDAMTTNARLRASLLAGALPSTDVEAIIRVTHLSQLEKAVFGSLAGKCGYDVVDPEGRGLTTTLRHAGRSDDSGSGMDLSLDEDGTVLRS